MRIGIVGIGKFGSVLARRAVAAGHDVVVAGRPGAASTPLVAEVMVPGAVAAPIERWPTVDLAILAVPFSVALAMDLPLPEGTIAVDATNHWVAIDGERDQTSEPSTQRVAAAHPQLRWVKALNQLGYHDLEDLPLLGAERIASGIATDDEQAADVVAAFVASIGLDPVRAGTIAHSGALEEEGPVFGASLTRAQWLAAMAARVAGITTSRRAPTGSRRT